MISHESFHYSFPTARMFVEICLFFSWPGSSKEENHVATKCRPHAVRRLGMATNDRQGQCRWGNEQRVRFRKAMGLEMFAFRMSPELPEV